MSNNASYESESELGAVQQILVSLVYLGIGTVQFFAIMDGLQLWFGLSTGASVFISIFLAYIPLLGAVMGMYGAVTAWGWSWVQATGLFFGFFILFFGIIILLIGASSIHSLVKKKDDAS